MSDTQIDPADLPTDEQRLSASNSLHDLADRILADDGPLRLVGIEIKQDNHWDGPETAPEHTGQDTVITVKLRRL